MEILVFVKPVPEAESRLRPRADGKGLDPEGVKWVLTGYDESAVEQALLMKEALAGSHVRSVSFGPAPRGEEVLRASLALGCDSATWVEQPPGIEPDSTDLVRTLALVSRRYPADLILLGKQAGDHEGGLAASALAAALGRPGFSFVVNLRFEAARQRFTFQRVAEEGVESWEVPGPIVVGLQQAWNDPRTAKLQNILKSRRMPIEKVPTSEVVAAVGDHPRSTVEQFLLPPPRTGAKMVEFSTPEEAAQKLVRLLREEAKVFP